MFQAYLPLIEDRPWRGHGLGSFNRLNDAQISLQNAALTEQMGAAHNVVLQWLLQQGIIGLSVMCAAVLWILVTIARALRRAQGSDASMLLMVLCMSGLFLGHGMVDFALEIPAAMWFFSFWLGLATGRAHRLNSRTRAPTA